MKSIPQLLSRDDANDSDFGLHCWVVGCRNTVLSTNEKLSVVRIAKSHEAGSKVIVTDGECP